MEERHRAIFGLLVFLGLCAAIAQALARNSEMTLNPAVGFGAAAYLPLLLVGVIPAIALYYGRAGIVARDISLLSGAVWDLVRLMENTPRDAFANRSTGRKDLLHHFAVEGAEKVAAGRPMPMGDTAGLDLTKLAFELMDRNDRDGSSTSTRLMSIKRGLFVFYAIVELRRPGIAYRAMIDHMNFQLRLGQDSGVHNFTELKKVLGLPAQWPASENQVAQLEREGLAIRRKYAIDRALDKGLPTIFSGVRYIPPGSAAETVGYTGPADIINQIREYIR
jgi:hypothetical protein